MRSSYSTPSAFSRATTSPFRWCSWAAQDRAGVVEHGLDDAQHVERVGGGVGVEPGDRLEHERAERLVEGEVGLQVDGDAHPSAALVGLVELLEHAGGDERPVHRDGPPDVAALGRPGSSLSVSRWRSAAHPSPGRSSTLSSIEWLTVKLDVSGSGGAATRRSKVASPHDT